MCSPVTCYKVLVNRCSIDLCRSAITQIDCWAEWEHENGQLWGQSHTTGLLLPPLERPRSHFPVREPKECFPHTVVSLFPIFLLEKSKVFFLIFSKFLLITWLYFPYCAALSSLDASFVCRWRRQTKLLDSAPTYLPQWTSWWLWSIPFLVSDDIKKKTQINK